MTEFKNASIHLKVSIFPSETEMLPIYERLIGLSERECAKSFKIALIAIHEFKTVPGWFYSLERNKFPTARGRAFRLKLDPRDASTREIFDLINPMTNTERIIALKAMFRDAVLSKKNLSQAQTNAPLPVQPPASRPIDITALKQTTPQESTQPSEESNRKKSEKIKCLAGLYR